MDRRDEALSDAGSGNNAAPTSLSESERDADHICSCNSFAYNNFLDHFICLVMYIIAFSYIYYTHTSEYTCSMLHNYSLTIICVHMEFNLLSWPGLKKRFATVGKVEESEYLTVS